VERLTIRCITDEVVVEMLQRSQLTEDELADLWEDVRSGICICELANARQALKAMFSSAVTAETRLGFLNKDEFFVLLSELQGKSGISDEAFSKTFLPKDVPARPRRNPFKEKSSVKDTIPMEQSFEMLSEHAEAVNSGETNYLVETDKHAKEGVESTDETPISPQNLSPAADGHPEGTAVLVVSTLTPNTPSGLSPVLAPSTNVGKDDKEVVDRPRALKSSDQNYPPLEPVAQTQRKPLPLSTGTRSGEIEIVGHTISDKEVRPADGVDFMSLKQVYDRSQNPHLDETQQQLVLYRSSPASPPNRPSAFNTASNMVEAEAPISTSASDDLALQRLTALRATEPQLPPRPEKKQSFSRRILTKTHLSKSPKQCSMSTDSTTIGRRFSLRLLSQALHDAAAKGNLPLVASLFKFGANVNFSSLDPPNHHHILGAAAMSGHIHIVDYFTVMGADDTSIDQAFTSAFNNGHLEMAMRLVPHINIYSLKLFVNPSRDVNIRISLLGQVARNTAVPANNRERMLEALIDQKQFSATKMVYEISDKKPPSEDRDKRSQSKTPNLRNDVRASYNIMQLLISRLDVDLVERITTKLGNTPPESTFHDWVITFEEWQKNPLRALEMLQLLISKSAPLDNKTESQGRMEMTPLAHAVAGGCLEAVRLLLELNADPECLIYEPPRDGNLSKDAYTALGWAARQGRVDLCRELVGAGAIPWRTGAFNRTPLYWASGNDHLEVVEYLLSLDTKRSSIDSCLIAAITWNEPKIAKILVDSGASINSDTVCIPKTMLLTFSSNAKSF
jgi:ankyrin repeat protein